MHATRNFEQNGTKDPSSMSTQPLLIVRLPIQQTRSLFHPLNALWPVKCKSPILYLCLESELCLSLQISIRSQLNLFHSWINLYSLSQMKSLIHKPLSLITKTRIRGLDAFTAPTPPRASSNWSFGAELLQAELEPCQTGPKWGAT